MSRSLRLLTVLTLSSIACAPAQRPAASRKPRAETATAAPQVTDQLSSEARFADLVRSAAELEARQRPGSGCLLAPLAGGGYQLRAELALAVRPLPLAPDDLDEALKSVERVELLSAWGRHGDGNGKLALVGFTASRPTAEAVALVMTDRGLSLRGASGSPVTPRDELTLTDALAALPAGDSSTVFVAAEAGRPVRELASVLEGLTQQGREVVLAVSLSLNTTLPLPTSATAKVTRCQEGLSATDAPEGSLPNEALSAGVAALRDGAPDCLLRGDARGAAGGRLSVALRVAANGRVQEACIASDQLGDPGVAACVIELAQALSFPPPSPTGVIDLELPIVLRPSPRPPQRALCGP